MQPFILNRVYPDSAEKGRHARALIFGFFYFKGRETSEIFSCRENNRRSLGTLSSDNCSGWLEALPRVCPKGFRVSHRRVFADLVGGSPPLSTAEGTRRPARGKRKGMFLSGAGDSSLDTLRGCSRVPRELSRNHRESSNESQQ